MLISAIVALSENRAIGKNNQLPWHLPADLKHFKQITMGKAILMGRKTYQSIGRALPGRTNIILTSDKNFQAENCVIIHSIEQALQITQDELCVIGGAEIYQQMLPYIQRIYMTVVHHVVDGDTYFPELNPAEWKEIEKTDHEADEKNNYAYRFLLLERSERPVYTPH